jgi:hypothetical protein
LAQQIFGVFDGGFGRSIEPFNTFEVCRKSLQEQRSGGQVGAPDFGRVLSGTANEVFERIEADGAAGRYVRRVRRVGWRRPG